MGGSVEQTGPSKGGLQVENEDAGLEICVLLSTYGGCCACVGEEEKGNRRGKRLEERNRKLENFLNKIFLRISKRKYKELVQKLILYKKKK
jgi:hypothetical protein